MVKLGKQDQISGEIFLRTNRPFRSLICLLLLLCLIPGPKAFAASPPSGAGERKLEGGQRDLLWPVPGAYNLSSCFKDNRNHCALDIAADKGTTIIASYPGTVVDTYTSCTHNTGEYNCSCGGSYGNYVLIQHTYILKNGSSINLYTRYAHMTAVSVSKGQTVSAGTKLGTVGSTGSSTGFHLHFETRKDGYYKSHALDPYVNDLLELPDELHTTFGGCCKKYVNYVKELYPKCTHESYNAQGLCTACGHSYNWKETRNTGAMGRYTASADTSAVKLPYNGAEANASLSAGDKVDVNATVTNGLGETWYEVQFANGSVGYVPKAALSFAEYFDSEFQGSLTSLTEGQTLGQHSHRVDGYVRSRYPLRSVKGYLDGSCFATWTGSGNTTQLDFGNSVINKNLKFSKLAPGKHVLTITATDSTGRGEAQVIQCTFYIDQPPKVYTVTFSGETAQSIQVQENTPLGDLPTPTQEGFRFLGWFADEQDRNAVTPETVVTQNITLYPHWEQITYTVILGETSLTISHGSYIEVFPELTLAGHTLSGWFTEESGGTAITNQTPITQDLTLYPQWLPQEYTVTMDPGNGESAFQRTVTYGATYGQLPTPTREGFRFLGWLLEGTPIAEDNPVTADRNHTLTAHWEALPTEPAPTELTPTAPNPEQAAAFAPSPLWLMPILIALLGSSYVLLASILQRRRAANAFTHEAKTPGEEIPL